MEKTTLLNYFQTLLRIDTSNPPGSEEEAILFLEDLIKSHVDETKIFSPAKKRANLFAKIEGRKKGKPFILLNHIDTVPAKPEEWSFDPLSGQVENGFIYGRGAIDMKSQVICTALALIEILKEGLTPKRDIIFLVTADEECGGLFGVKYLLEKIEEIREPSFVLTEGGFIIEEDGVSHAQISVAEKKLAQFMIRAKGVGGHGSIRHPDNPNEKILRVANAILSHKFPLRITPYAERYLNGLFKGKSIDGFNFKDLKKAMRSKAFLRFLEGNPSIEALLRNTVNLTILKGGEKINVVPTYAEAHFDARLLPNEDHERFFRTIKKIAKEDIELLPEREGISNPFPSPYNTRFFRMIERVIKKRMGEIPVLPYITTGATDLRFFRKRGVPAYGFFFLPISREEIKRMHGVDERISINGLNTAMAATKEIIGNLFLLI